MIREAILRDSLARKLSILESGLILEGTETPVKNLKGSGGRLDIYARDRFGNRVVIEVKRSDKAARESIHELYKYISLLQETYGVRADQIRCLLVSTEWRELRLPFSTFVLDTNYEVQGFQAHIDEEGNILEVDKVEPLPRSEALIWEPMHDIYFFQDEERRERFIQPLSDLLKTFEGAEFSMIPMNYVGSDRAIIFPYCLYVAMARITPKRAAEVIAVLEQDDPRPQEENLDDNASLEEKVRAYVNRRIADARDDWELGYNKKFSNMLRTWECGDSIRIGPRITSRTFHSESDVQGNVKGYEGQHEFIYDRVLSPDLSENWRQSKRNIEQFLNNNEPWQNIILWFLNNLDDMRGIAVNCYIYNPCNVMSAMWEIHRSEAEPRIPLANIFVEDAKTGNRRFGLIGELAWNGETKNIDLEEMLTRIVGDLTVARNFVLWGQIRDFEGEICWQHGLEYLATLVEFDEFDHRPVSTLVWHEGKCLSLQSEEHPPRPLEEFCREHPEYMHALDRFLSESSIELHPGMDVGKDPVVEIENYGAYDKRYYELANSLLRSRTSFDLEILAESADLALMETAYFVGEEEEYSDEELSEDKPLRSEALLAIFNLLKLSPNICIKHLRNTFGAFSYSGLFDVHTDDVFKMWKQLKEREQLFDRLESDDDRAWIRYILNTSYSHRSFLEQVRLIIEMKENGEYEEIESRLAVAYEGEDLQHLKDLRLM